MKNIFEQEATSMTQKTPRPINTKRTSTAAMMESLFACKWSVRILTLIRNGTTRSGEITRSLDGLTTKVMNDCLRKHIEFGIVVRHAYPEIPPRVEYHLSPFGLRVVEIIDAVEALQSELISNNQKKE